MSIILSGNLAHGFEDVCTICADLSGLSGALKRWGSDGTYWRLDYQITIQFCGTELQAYLEWTEGVSASVPEFSASLMPYYTQGEMRKSQAQIIPNSLM